MNILDIFYSILQESSFFSCFFYQQFLLDINAHKVYDIKENQQYSLSSFLKKHPIASYLESTQDITYCANHNLLIKPRNFPQYRVLLYISQELSYIKNTPVLLASEQLVSLTNQKTLDTLLYKNPTYPIYIAFFDFYSNQDLSNPETHCHIFTTIQEILANTHSYFHHESYNKYYIIYKNLSEMEVLTLCTKLHMIFTKTNTPFLYPKFLITQYNPAIAFEEFIKKVKQSFIQLPYDESIIITKRDISNL